MDKTIQHNELIKLGAHWLSCSHNGIEFGVSHHQYSHPIVLKELVSANFSIPDIIGFRSEYSTVIECKVSRQDYQADKLKSHRYHLKQPGNYRYYLTPENMIANDENYDGWGLLETDGCDVFIRLAAPYHGEPEIKVSEYHILYSFARRKMQNLLKYTQI